MSLLDGLMPCCELREVDHLASNAGRAQAWQAVRAIDAEPLIPLAEDAGREIVRGAVGQVWHRRVLLAPVARDRFASFTTPGFTRIAFGLSVVARPGGAWVTIDVRAAGEGARSHATARLARSLRRDARAKLVEALGGGVPDERADLPGDAVIPMPRAQATHHVDIEAPPDVVWPWLVQMGRRRGGWYSWDALDNGGIPSADHIIPALQAIAVGDILPLTPKGDGGLAVLVLDPPRALVLGDPSLLPGAAKLPEGAPRATWAFSLEPIGDSATHLVVRVRADYAPTLAATLVLRPLVGGLHEVMERKQLRGIKQRAEATP